MGRAFASGKIDLLIHKDDFLKAVALFDSGEYPEEEKSEESNGALKGYTCCLTGDFKFGQKSDVEEYIKNLGGKCVSSVTKSTNMLIIGAKGSSMYAHGSYGSKYLKAKAVKDSGADMTIIEEADFFERFK